MAETPKDLKVGEVIKDAKPILEQAPAEIDQVKQAIDSIMNAALAGGPEEAALRTRLTAVKAGIDSGLMSAVEAVDATSKLLKQFSLPLAIVGGMKLQGSGEALEVITKADAAGKNILQGLKTSMTRNQKLIRSSYAIIAILIGAGISIASSLQQGGLVSPAGGAGIMAIFSGIKEGLAVLNSVYEGVTGTDLSK
jgi:hypothetical protein